MTQHTNDPLIDSLRRVQVLAAQRDEAGLDELHALLEAIDYEAGSTLDNVAAGKFQRPAPQNTEPFATNEQISRLVAAAGRLAYEAQIRAGVPKQFIQSLQDVLIPVQKAIQKSAVSKKTLEGGGKKEEFKENGTIDSVLQREIDEGKYDKMIENMVRCYDNGGETIDRYTVVYTKKEMAREQPYYAYAAMNTEPFHPQGFGQHGESNDHPIDHPSGHHLGKKIKLADLPEDCKKLVRQDIDPQDVKAALQRAETLAKAQPKRHNPKPGGL